MVVWIWMNIYGWIMSKEGIILYTIYKKSKWLIPLEAIVNVPALSRKSEAIKTSIPVLILYQGYWVVKLSLLIEQCTKTGVFLVKHSLFSWLYLAACFYWKWGYSMLCVSWGRHMFFPHLTYTSWCELNQSWEVWRGGDRQCSLEISPCRFFFAPTGQRTQSALSSLTFFWTNKPVAVM